MNNINWLNEEARWILKVYFAFFVCLQFLTFFIVNIMYNIVEVVYMLISFLIKINREKLERMITSNCNYNDILKQSQKLDKYINMYIKRNWKNI